MGNSSSHTHEPLDKGKGFTRGTYGDVKNVKSASFRFSKRSSPKKMDRLRRSFRDSFRRRKDRVPESSKPHQWQADELAVRSATCSFAVKYLGCVEVFESRGMQVCEEALKVLRNSRRRPVRGLLHVSGDGLRVVDDETKGLIVDQTIEKVSFCAPDRNHERGFSYICRDGTTRRWMCHGFLANKDSGERLSHAVGCAFAVCLERKQRRDKECGVTMTFDMKNSTFTRSGSFRQQSITERLMSNERNVDALQQPPQQIISAIVPPQQKPFNPFAIERPHATPSMLERQGSFRAFSTIGSQSPFKRQMSLRINDLPSNAERQKAFLDASGGLKTPQQRVSPIPEILSQKASAVAVDTVSQLCQELSQGLSLLTHNDIDELNIQNKTSPSQNIMHSPTTPPFVPEIATPEKPQIVPRDSIATAANIPTNMQSTTRVPQVYPCSRSTSIEPDSISVASKIPLIASSIVVSPSTAESRVGVPIEMVAPYANPENLHSQVAKSTSPTTSRRIPPPIGLSGRAKSLSSANSVTITSSDPFDAEWAAGVAKASETHNTNPFISPLKPPAQSFQVQL